jgi:polyhydroxyalkanoate synthesis regulator phasin
MASTTTLVASAVGLVAVVGGGFIAKRYRDRKLNKSVKEMVTEFGKTEAGRKFMEEVMANAKTADAQ